MLSGAEPPGGEVFYKPSFDEEFVDTDRRKNWETRSAQKVIQFTIPEPWRVNALRVTYSGAVDAEQGTD